MSKTHDPDPRADQDSRIASAGAQARDAAGQVIGKAEHVYEAAVEKVTDVVAVARERGGDAFSTAREKASDVYAAARDRAKTASETTVSAVGESPLAALIGGIAIGVVAGALLPKTVREAALLAPLGAKLGDAAKLAAGAAKEAGLNALDEKGVSKDAAREQIDKLFDAALGALRSAGGAAAETVRKPG